MTKFCIQCGAQVAETARFCNKCGKQLLPTPPTQAGEAPPRPYQSPSYQQPPNYGQMPYQAPYQSPAAHADLKPNVAGMLCYPLSIITGILFLVLAPYNKDRFVRFHAWQSIFLFAALAVSSVVLQIFPRPLDDVFMSALVLLAVAGTGFGMYKAYHSEEVKLPLIGDWAENQAAKNID
jgi:uncharacterized membrane protein